MGKHIRPYNNFIIVKPDPAPTHTDGGIEIPLSATNFVQLQWGTVMRVSKSVKDIKEGDRIYFPASVGQEDTMEGVKYKWLTTDPSANMIWGIEVEDELKAV